MNRAEPRCFHCGEPIPAGTEFTLRRGEESLLMCCAGCLAVAELIHASGLDRYYRFRQAEARRASDDLAQARAAWMACDERPGLWGEELDDGQRDLLLQTEGIRCAACAWLIRSQLSRQRGVDEVQVDVASGYTRIRWRPDLTRLSRLALALLELGYKPHLPIASEQERARQEERRRSLRRLGIAGLGMMQVMMYAVGLYAGEALGMGEGAERFLEWVSLLVTTPVLLYSGREFFEGAWRGLRAGQPGMDLPVALAIGIAYLASCIGFFRGTGEVWFDSVVMFIFFLLLGRHVEMVLRHRNQQSGAVLARLLPEWVQRVTASGTETVLADDLRRGDRVRVRPGEAFPADGVLLDGATEVNEALLTGESFARARQAGDTVIAGTINVLQPVQMEVHAAGLETTVSALGRLLEKARTGRSRTAFIADRIAGVFVVSVLFVATLAALAWAAREPAMALPVALAVLVVSCPCALSLAAPAAVAAASRALLRAGIILTRGEALEALARADLVVFDKTGTLTAGEPEIAATHLNPKRQGLDEQRALDIAGGLELASAHPLAQAFSSSERPATPERVEAVAGQGVRGWIDGSEYRIGTATFAVSASSDVTLPPGAVVLADHAGWIAAFELRDRPRSGARSLVASLRSAGIETLILSGDVESNVAPLAEDLGIARWVAGLDPAGKLAALERLKQDGRRVLMIGDGINDAPVLAAADVSVAVQGGTELANSVADFILTGRSLSLVWHARDIAQGARRIITQNLLWALGYNVTMIPLAVSGLLQPWMAAIGMSASSLLVVLNAARLSRPDARRRALSRLLPQAEPS